MDRSARTRKPIRRVRAAHFGSCRTGRRHVQRIPGRVDHTFFPDQRSCRATFRARHQIRARNRHRSLVPGDRGLRWSWKRLVGTFGFLLAEGIDRSNGRWKWVFQDRRQHFEPYDRRNRGPWLVLLPVQSYRCHSRPSAEASGTENRRVRRATIRDLHEKTDHGHLGRKRRAERMRSDLRTPGRR